MVNRKILVCTAVCLLVLFAAWRLWPTERQAIRRQLQNLRELSAKDGAEQGVEPLRRAARIGDLFTDPCRFVFEEYDGEETLDRKTLINHVLHLRNRTQSLHLSLHDTEIVIIADDTAGVTTTLRVESSGNEDLFTDVREIDLGMQKADGDWRIARVTLVEVLEK